MEALHHAALQTTGPVKATLVRIDLPSGAVCLTDGGFADFDAGDGVRRFFGEHPTFGMLSSIPSIQDGAESTTTRLDVTVLPRDDDAAAAYASPAAQGSRVRWWEAVIDFNTGLIVGVPELKFDGEHDMARFSVGGSWEMVLVCGTQAERQVEPNADWRLNHALHSRIWAGETGLVHVTGVTRKLEWRERPPNPGLFKRLFSVFKIGSAAANL